jgi:hypothetical protein
VERARARLHAVTHHGHKRIRRDVGTGRVRHALEHRNYFSMPKPRHVEGGRLELILHPPQHHHDGDASEVAGSEPSGNCSVDPTTITGVGCNILRSDTAAVADATGGLWGNVECASASRYQFEHSGGDSAPESSGASQGNDSYRSLTVLDGDDFAGERCELGRNESRYGDNTGAQTDGTFALYEEGDHDVTFLSQRYPDNFSPAIQAWQTVMQMKQAQPSDNGGGGPVIEIQIYGGRLHLINRWHEIWSTPAPVSDKWIRYALDVNYSPDPEAGSMQLYVDLNGDGDATDAGEQSPQFHVATMLTETNGPNGTSDGYAPGDTIPDHLRVGIYHNPSIPCPPPSGCSVDVDNVQVAG